MKEGIMKYNARGSNYIRNKMREKLEPHNIWVENVQITWNDEETKGSVDARMLIPVPNFNRHMVGCGITFDPRKDTIHKHSESVVYLARLDELVEQFANHAIIASEALNKKD